jgi:hypothetical protein
MEGAEGAEATGRPSHRGTEQRRRTEQHGLAQIGTDRTNADGSVEARFARGPVAGLMIGHIKPSAIAPGPRVRVAALCAARGQGRSGSRTDLHAHRFVIPISPALVTAGRTAGHTNTPCGCHR